MKSDLIGRKLLYLGGISRARYVVERAQKLGIYVIVADYYEDSPAKAIANESVLISAMDVDALAELCKNKHIDGIMTGYCDILLPVCKAVSDKVGMPCYYTEQLLSLTTDKDCFKSVCIQYGMPVAQKYDVDDSRLSESAGKLSYPVFVKPIDGSGSRGASACFSEGEFEHCYKGALAWSKKGVVSVEELLYGTEFILDYAVVDGDARLMSMADRYSLPSRPAAVNSPNIMILPSKYLDRYYQEVDPLVRKMFAGIHFDNGIFFLQGYSNPNKIAFYEAGCRLGGTWPYIDEFYSKINPMDMLFRHAITGEMIGSGESNTISAKFSGFAAIIYLLSNVPEGRIAKIEGTQEITRYDWVVHTMQYYYEGDSFNSSRMTDVRFFAVHLVAPTFSSLKERMKIVYSKVRFYDEKGTSLLMPDYDVDSLSGYGE